MVSYDVLHHTDVGICLERISGIGDRQLAIASRPFSFTMSPLPSAEISFCLKFKVKV